MQCVLILDIDEFLVKIFKLIKTVFSLSNQHSKIWKEKQ